MKRLAFIGGGRIASALMDALVASGRDRAEMAVSDINAQALEKRAGMFTTSDNALAADFADIIILAVKPQHMEQALEPMRGRVKGKTVVSVAAGITTEYLRSRLDSPAAVVRVMPNTPMLLGMGTIAIAFGGAPEATKREISDIFSLCGSVFETREELLDAVTALSGSGPAYFYRVAADMAAWGEAHGLEQAVKMAALTMKGAAEMMLSSGKAPAELIRDVSSPGGTTLAALSAFDRAGLDPAVEAGLDAAFARSAELGKK